MIFKLTLKDLRHIQPEIPIHCDKATAVGITNIPIKLQQSWVMDMRYFWTREKEAQDDILLNGSPGWKILLITKLNSTLGRIILR